MRSSATLTFTVDDCLRQDALGFGRAFDSVGFKGVFYVIADLVGKEVNGMSFLDWDALRRMAADKGHEVGSHSLTHRTAGLNIERKAARLLHQIRVEGVRKSARRLSYSADSRSDEYGMTHFSQPDEILLSKRRVEEEIKAPCMAYSYPGGGYTRALEALVESAGYSSARTGYSGDNAWGKIDLYALRVRAWDRDTTCSEANSWVNKAIERGNWLIEVFHRLGIGEYPYGCSQSDLMEHLDYVRRRTREIETLTISEAL